MPPSLHSADPAPRPGGAGRGGFQYHLIEGWGGVAIPASQDPPIVLDMVTSVVAGGKLDLAAARGQKIPLGWAVDSEGKPTDDPAAARKGLLLPIGEHKGYGLTVVFEILAAVLAGANFARHVPWPAQPNQPMNIGHFFQAIAPANFMPVHQFKERLDDLIHQLKSSRRAPGIERIYLPGEREWEKRQLYQSRGIPLAPKVVQELNHLASRLGV